MFLNLRNYKEAKELRNLKTENENKTFSIKSLKNVSQITNSFLKNQGKQNDIKVTTTILPEEPTFIEPKKFFKRNCNYQNSSYNETLK